jgi:hypothetical protein
MEVLMEWLTTEPNYADYCGANGNKGKTKTQHHKELALLIQQKLPQSERTEKDVENKITSLERQFPLIGLTTQDKEWIGLETLKQLS